MSAKKLKPIEHYISRVHRQHSSVVVVIPINVRKILGIEKGDYVLFEVSPGTEECCFSKFVPGGGLYGGSTASPDKSNNGGGLCASSGDGR